MTTPLFVFILVCATLLVGAMFLHLVSRFAPSLHDVFCRAPLLDLVVAFFTVSPWVIGPVVGVHAGRIAPGLVGEGASLAWGWGLLAGVAAQIATVLVWSRAHEWRHREAVRGPRIVKALNRSVGPLRNHAAVWWTALAVPVFWFIRAAEVIVYPPLVWIVRFPRYRQGEWINVSRHKFSGLVGHDLIWCLYCDWMTGVWSLGSEMLRNVESFWCPIRFLDDKKCENCVLDFPDVEGGWVRPEAGMAGAAKVVEAQYPPGQRENSWFGHPGRATTRVTIEGKPPTS
ncbi:MAG: hypothetical protein KF684_02570 [Phycisphaeraceae bacterium]|nr:hypothetical protein [Phycisphaeraceae bacterium]